MHDALTASYKKTLVSYVDILGFSAMIEKSRKDPAEIANLRDRLTAMRRVAFENSEHRNSSGERIKVVFDSFSFSDLVVRCTGIGDELPWFILLNAELHYLATRQISLAAEGVLIRGGISMGDLFINPEKTTVFGPAFVRSYELESEQAIYPRIVVDRELVFEAKKENAWPLLRDLLLHGEDGTYFLDYLSGTLATKWDPPMNQAAREVLIGGHRRTIETNIRNNAKNKDERFKQKYRWLALYHNEVVKKLVDRPDAEQFSNAPELLISEDCLTF
jgi:hypothetical protein